MDTASYPPHRPSSKIASSQSLVFLVPSSVLHLLCVTFTCVMLAGCSSDASVVANTAWARLDVGTVGRYGPRGCERAAARDVTIAFTSLLFVVIVIALVVSVMRLTKRFTHRLKGAGIVLPILALICDTVAVGTFTGSCVVGLDHSDVGVSLTLGFIMLPILLIICALQIADHRRKTSTATTTASGARCSDTVELEQYQEDSRSSPPLLRRPSSKIVSSQSCVFLVPSTVLHLLCVTFTCVMLAGCSSDASVVANTAWARLDVGTVGRYGPRGCERAAARDVTIAFTSLLFVVIVIAFVVSVMRLTKRFTHRLKGAGIVLPILALICDTVAVGTFTGSCVVGLDHSDVGVSLILGFIMLPILLIICVLQIADHRKTSTATTTSSGTRLDAVGLEQYQGEDRVSPPLLRRRSSKIVSSQSCVFLVPSTVLHLLCVIFTCVMLAGCSSDPSVITAWARNEDTGYDDFYRDDYYDNLYLPYRFGPSWCGGHAGDVTIAFTSLLFVVIVIALVVSAMRLTKRFTHRLKGAGIVLPILALICDTVAVGTFTGSCVNWSDYGDVDMDVSLILGFTMIPVLLIIADHRQASTTAIATSGARSDTMELEQYQEDRSPSSKIVSSQSRVLLVPSSVLHLLCVTFTCVMLAGCSSDESVVANTAWSYDGFPLVHRESYYGPRVLIRAEGWRVIAGNVTIVFTSLLFVVIVIAFVVSVMRLTKRFTHRLKGAGIVLPILALICDSVAVGTFSFGSFTWWGGHHHMGVSLILGFTMIPLLLIIIAFQLVERRYETTSTTATTVTTTNHDDAHLTQMEARLAGVELVQQEQQQNNLRARLADVEIQPQGMCPPTTTETTTNHDDDAHLTQMEARLAAVELVQQQQNNLRARLADVEIQPQGMCPPMTYYNSPVMLMGTTAI